MSVNQYRDTHERIVSSGNFVVRLLQEHLGDPREPNGGGADGVLESVRVAGRKEAIAAFKRSSVQAA